MPEFVANGPVIPVALLNQLDSGEVVFFCGAGVSATAGSDLPGFAELVHHVYEENHLDPDTIEREALDYDQPDISRRRPSFDKALGLLERRLGSRKLRETIIARLSEPATGELVVHKALIDLSLAAKGVRLITTNFDDRFVEAGVPKNRVDAAPKLPIPKAHSWSSLVHLHGRILPEHDGSDLVLTAADFGRAYLTERWAARFITEVFREFTVVFVGYSLSDPVMSYMVDALAAERAKGVRFAKAYAFANHDGTALGVQRTRDAWLAKNVSPMLYPSCDDHALLADTLMIWAGIRKDPFQARSEIALDGIQKMPAGADEPLVQRVNWALDDPTSALALAISPPTTEESEFPKIRAWLDQFSLSGVLSYSANPTDAAGPSPEPSVVRLVDVESVAFGPLKLDSTRTHLALWISRHLHVPQVLAWVLENGGHMHPALRRQVRFRLGEPGHAVPPRLRLLWTILLGQKPIDRQRFLGTSRHYRAAKSDPERQRIEGDIVQGLAPRLVVCPGPALSLVFAKRFDGGGTVTTLLDDCAHLQLVIGDEDARDQIRDVLRDFPALARHALPLTAHLDKAVSLGELCDDGALSYAQRPSIATHGQNPEHNHDGWGVLIDLVRDSYLALAIVDPKDASSLLRHWTQSNHLLFRRLALHALTEDPKSDIRLAKDLLLAGRKPGLWDLDLHREMLRFLRLGGSRLPRDLRVELVRAIHAGPKRVSKLPESVIRREKALRLFKLAESGALLDKKSRALANEVAAEMEGSSDHREEFLIWRGEATWLPIHEPSSPELRDGTYRDVMAAIRQQQVDHSLRAIVVEQPAKAVAAVRRLAVHDELTLPIWEGFLHGIAQLRDAHPSLPKSRRSACRALSYAPDELFTRAPGAAAEFIQHLAENYADAEETEFGVLWERVWQLIDHAQSGDQNFDDPLTVALNHPTGKLAHSAITRLSKHQPQAGGGLPSAVRPYFDAIVKGPDSGIGRIMLATSLLRLHDIAPEWTAEHLIKRLDPSRSDEALSLWSAYAWSPTARPNLLVAFKESFLEVVLGRLGKTLQARLTPLFMAICLEAPDQLDDDEIHRVVETMSEPTLQRVLQSLKQRMKGDPEARGRVWIDKIYPWLQQYWPNVLARNTSATSQSMLDMLVEAGDAFPEAVDWAAPYLCPIEGPGLYLLGVGDIPEQYPAQAFRLIKAVVANDVLPANERPVLCQLMDRLKATRPALAQDPAFQNLYRLATL